MDTWSVRMIAKKFENETKGISQMKNKLLQYIITIGKQKKTKKCKNNNNKEAEMWSIYTSDKTWRIF